MVFSGNSHFKKGRRAVHRIKKCPRVWGSLRVIRRGNRDFAEGREVGPQSKDSSFLFQAL